MLKKITPHLVALITFIIVSAVYFAPQYEGRDVRQSDDVHATGMRGGIQEHVKEHGEHPQWAPNMFSGMPAYLIDMNYDGRLLKEASAIFYFLGTPTAYYFLLMAGFYFMLLCFGVSPWLAIVGGLGYGLSTYFFIIYEAGHITKIMALCFIAPLIGSIYLAFTRNLWLGASLAAMFTAIEVSTSHPQITYYFLFVIFALFISQMYEFFKAKKHIEFLKRSGVLIGAAILGVGANVVQLYYISNYAGDSTRSKSELKIAEENIENQTSGLDKDYITAWSYGKLETFNLYIPSLYGGGSSGGFETDGEVAQALSKYDAQNIAVQLPAYWGPQPFTSGPVYIGAVMVFLCFLGMFLLKKREKYWLLAVTLLCFALAWGKHFMWFNDLFIYYLPGYNKLRTVSMILVIAEWTIPLIGILALKKLWDNEITANDFKKALRNAVILAVSITGFFIVMGGSLLDFNSTQDSSMGMPPDVIKAMQAERQSLMISDAFRSMIFSLITAGVVWLFFNCKIKKSHFVIGLSVLVLADMIPVNKRFLNDADFIPLKEAEEIKPTQANLQILQDEDLSYRVANLSVSIFNDATTSHFHKSVGGYHAAKMRRYQEVIDKYLSKMDMDVYNMLNTRYFIQKTEEGSALSVAYNDKALGNGWFVENVELVKSVDDEYNRLGEINPGNTAVVNEKFAKTLEGVELTANVDSLSSITLVNYKANELRYKTESTKKALAVFSEIYYPKGWSAYIDGEPAEILCVNYILRGLVIPAGEHNVEFKFEAPNFKIVVAITYISSILIILMLIISIYITYRGRNGKV